MKEEMIRVALIIPVHNRREITLQCLRSLARIDKKGLEIRIIIVDDGSSDGTASAIERDFPDVELLYGDGSLHYAAGTNLGIEAALKWDPDYIVTMNDDAVFHDQFLQNLIETATNNGRSIVGALLLLWDEPHRVFQVAPVWKTLRGGWIIPEDLTAFDVGDQPFPVELIVGNCVLFPTAAIRECGLMDAGNFPHGWGDAQYLVRMKRAGWNLLVDPRSRVWCEPNTYPRPLHQLGTKQILHALFKDRRNPQNLHRQWISRRESAPNRAKALIAFGAYLLDLAAKSFRFSYTRIGPR